MQTIIIVLLVVMNLLLLKIMSNLSALVAAATALSTASDGLSIKLDTLITKIDAVVVALQNVELPPEGEAALAALKASADTAAQSGAKVDTEVAKLDGILPTPAPGGETTPPTV